MKLEDITNVFCLSCVLIFFNVSCQPSCTPGWFGHQCKYKCRCDNSKCDTSGSCIQPFTCVGGWFGPECQYADLAYRTANLTEITDGNDTTCNDANAGDRITILFDQSVFFTWLRIHVTDHGSGALRNLTVTFNSNTNSVPCSVWRNHAVSQTILDMHCNLSQTITDMTLTGQAVPHLCSVYVSGGRNVAIKETAWQETTYNHVIGYTYHLLGAEKAVDGNPDQTLNHLSCSHTVDTTSWIVTLSRQRSVCRYVIYNRAAFATERLIGLKLESFNSVNSSVFMHKDKNPNAQLIYTIVHSPQTVQMVMVTTYNSFNITTLCEVEVYGDSICDPQHYGRDCEHPCNCVNNENCFVSTGACPSGCAPGFGGDSCLTTCPAGKLGNYCNLTCSDNCQPFPNRNTPRCDNNAVCQTQCKAGFALPSCTAECSGGNFGINCNQSCSSNCETSGQAGVSSCDTKTGACTKGCQSGFTGAMCGDECGVGKFGMNCTESCSSNCATSGQGAVSSCDTKNGTCLKGCKSGFTGDLCTKDAPKATSFLMEILLGLAGLLVVVFILIFCLRRQKQKPEAAEKTDVHAQLGEH